MHNPVAASPRMHPNLALTYRHAVETLHVALAAPDGGAGALPRIRALIDRVDIGPVAVTQDNTAGKPAAGPQDTPSKTRHPKNRRADLASRHEIILMGAIASMVELALGDGARRAANDGALGFDRALFMRSVKVVAGPGFEPGTFRL